MGRLKIKGIKGKLIVTGVRGSIAADEDNEELKKLFYQPEDFKYVVGCDPYKEDSPIPVYPLTSKESFKREPKVLSKVLSRVLFRALLASTRKVLRLILKWTKVNNYIK